MIKETNLVKIKDYFGLNIYETKVWLALLIKGVASVGEVASISKVPRSRAYDVLESLEKKGFAIVKIGKPVKYLGIKPKMVLEKLKNDIKRETNDKIIDLSSMKDSQEFKELEGLYHSGIDSVKREELSASLKGKSNISLHLKEMIKRAKEEVIVCHDVNEVNARLKVFLEAVNHLKKSKIKVSFILFGDEVLIKKVEDALKIKVIRGTIESKFFIVDNSEIFFYLLKEEDKEDLGIWVNSPFFVSAFSAFFRKFFDEAK